MTELISKEELMKLWDEYHPYIATRASRFDQALRELPTIEILPETYSEMEYRKAKAPFFMTHRYIDEETKKEDKWVSAHCPVCFWNKDIDLWDSVIDRRNAFCSRCGQKIKWDEDNETD